MKCEPTLTPPAATIDIPALREKYRQERDKRLRPAGQKQYVRVARGVPRPLRHRPAHAGGAARADLRGDRRRHPRRGFRRDSWPPPTSGGGCHDFRNHRPRRRLRRRLVLEPLPRHPVRQRRLLLPAAAGRNRLHAVEEVRRRAEIHEYCQQHRRSTSALPTARCSTPWSPRCAGTNRSSAGGSAPTAATTSARASSSWPAACSTCPSCPAFPASTTSRARCSTPRAGTMTTPAATATNPVLDKLADKRVAIVGTGATAMQVVPHLGQLCQAALRRCSARRRPSTSATTRRPIPEWVEDPAARLAGGAAAPTSTARAMEGFAAGRAGSGLRHLDRDQPQPGRRAGSRGLARTRRPRQYRGAARSDGLPGDGAAAPPRRRAWSRTREPPRR